MKNLGQLIDAFPAEPLAALFGFLVFVLGVAIVFTVGWGLIVMGLGVLLYVFLPDQRASE